MDVFLWRAYRTGWLKLLIVRSSRQTCAHGWSELHLFVGHGGDYGMTCQCGVVVNYGIGYTA